MCVCVWGGGGGSTHQHYSLMQGPLSMYYIEGQSANAYIMPFMTDPVMTDYIIRACQTQLGIVKYSYFITGILKS